MVSVHALHTFVAEHADELEFSAGEQIEVLERDDAFGDGWWRVSRALSATELIKPRDATQKEKKDSFQRPISLKLLQVLLHSAIIPVPPLQIKPH